MIGLLLAGSVSGQEKSKGGKGKREETEAPKVKPLPDDKRLLALHLEFVKQAEKLGKEYEGDKDWGKARAVYEEILKLVPQYPPAQAKLAEMLEREATAKGAIISVKANEGWQDTGITVLAGKPLALAVSGTWVFHLEVDTNAEGLTIPKELRDFNPGCLIGMIPDQMDPDNNKPFVVGSSKQFMPERSGRLFLRMYDTDPRDNSGTLRVEVRGTFEQQKK
jgi:hypothetical protein